MQKMQLKKGKTNSNRLCETKLILGQYERIANYYQATNI